MSQLISQPIKNLVHGISQQPPVLRHPEQLEQQVNAFSTESSGLQKRPGTVHIAALGVRKDRSIKPLIHTIDRDEQEKYEVIFSGAGIEVFDLKGNKKTVSMAAGTAAYVTTSTPRSTLKVITIADYTFVANTTKTTNMSSAKTANKWATQGALINIKSGQYGRNYRILINGSQVAAFETPDGTDSSHSKQIATDYIAEQLATQVRSSGYTCVAGSSWLYITKVANGQNAVQSLEIYDGYNNQAAIGILKAVQKFTNLPSSAPDGFTVKVAGESGSTADDYYVAYDAKEGIWKETVVPDLEYKFDDGSMPHVLVRQADGSFLFKKAGWGERSIGDDDSNPVPSFAGQNINDIFFFRNRLGFIAGENVILSRSADFFNFWITSAIELQDTDPIDLAVSDNKVATLYHAVAFGEELLLFSAEAQFSLTAEGVLSPKNAKLANATNFASSLHAKPQGAGRNVYFIAERATHSMVKEYGTAIDDTEGKNAEDITSHVPSYLPNRVYKVIPSTIENLLLFLTTGAEKRIYIYKYLFLGGTRQQASWSYWEFKGDILGASFVGSELYLVIERKGRMYLEKISFSYNTKNFEEEPYHAFMDRKCITTLPASAYDKVTERTSFDIRTLYGSTDSLDTGDTYYILEPDGTLHMVQTDELVNGIVVFEGDMTGIALTVGQSFELLIEFSELMLKQQSESGTLSITEGRLQLKYFWVTYNTTGEFTLTVEQPDKGAYSYTHTGRTLGTASARMSKLPFTVGEFKVPVQGKSSNCSITIRAASPNPVSLIGAGWSGIYFRRTKQY